MNIIIRTFLLLLCKLFFFFFFFFCFFGSLNSCRVIFEKQMSFYTGNRCAGSAARFITGHEIFVCKCSNDVKSKLYYIQSSRANTVDLDEVANDEPLHQELPCLQIQLFSSLVLKSSKYSLAYKTRFHLIFRFPA